MNSTTTAGVILLVLVAATLLGMLLRRLLPEHHLGSDSKDAIKVAMGMVATMAALLLGLLVSSAKGAYDDVRNEVTKLAARTAFLDRALELYGPDAAEIRVKLRGVVQQAARQMWRDSARAEGTPDHREADSIYAAIHGLTPQDDTQRSAKAQAVSAAVELGQLRSSLQAQSLSSISAPMLVIVVCWLAVIFTSFSLLAPVNGTVAIAMVVAEMSVSAAIFLILELDRPFTGLVRVNSGLLLDALKPLTN